MATDVLVSGRLLSPISFLATEKPDVAMYDAGDVVMQKSAETDNQEIRAGQKNHLAFSLEKLPVAIRERWLAAMRADPAYNPNLTLRHTDFSPWHGLRRTETA